MFRFVRLSYLPQCPYIYNGKLHYNFIHYLLHFFQCLIFFKSLKLGNKSWIHAENSYSGRLNFKKLTINPLISKRIKESSVDFDEVVSNLNCSKNIIGRLLFEEMNDTAYMKKKLLPWNNRFFRQDFFWNFTFNS